MGAIAHGVNVRRAGAQVTVHHDGAARVGCHAGTQQAEGGGIGAAAGGQQQAVATDLTAIGVQLELLAVVVNTVGGRVRQHRDALFLEYHTQPLAQGRVFS